MHAMCDEVGRLGALARHANRMNSPSTAAAGSSRANARRRSGAVGGNRPKGTFGSSPSGTNEVFLAHDTWGAVRCPRLTRHLPSEPVGRHPAGGWRLGRSFG